MGGCKPYESLVERYYEKEIDYKVIEEVFLSLTVTRDQLFSLNPDMGIRDLANDFQEIFGRKI
ncbi:hypothetical protein AO068_05705 [Pseudomonas sp. ICMP 3272]|nr:hypothetical protein AO068_05705 [Pseudomonas sp. ICMP 3272]KTC54223.1 hypothetical protein AO258_05985 [Pseudomonas syringae ICMP 19498]